MQNIFPIQTGNWKTSEKGVLRTLFSGMVEILHSQVSMDSMGGYGGFVGIREVAEEIGITEKQYNQ